MFRGAIGAILGLGLGLLGPACARGTCEDKIAAMRATLEQVPANASSVHAVEVGGATALPLAARGEPVRDAAPLVRVAPDGALTLDGRGISPHSVAPQLVADGAKAVYVAFPPGDPVARHSSWLLDLGGAAVVTRVLVRVPSIEPPRTSAGDAALARSRAAKDPFGKVNALVESLRSVAANCPRLERGFRSLATEAVGRKQGLAMNLAIDSANECGCDKLDVDALSALIFYMLMGDDPGLRWLPLQAGVGSSRLIPGDATAHEMVKILESESRLGFAPH